MCEAQAKKTCADTDKIEWPEYIKKKGALETAGHGCKEGAANLNITANDAVNWFYLVLSSLDSKASALMRLNGVLIAAAAFMLGMFGRGNTSILSTTYIDSIFIIIPALLSALSIIFCLPVVGVSWKFLGKTTIDESGTCDFSEEINSLDRVVNHRQYYYRIAWWISLAASIIYIFEFSKQTIHVIFP
jgi:hypothetical protein